MITAVDSNVLIDLIDPSSGYAQVAKEALSVARFKGVLIICPVVVAEVSSNFSDVQALKSVLSRMELSVVEFSLEDAYQAGTAFRCYTRASSQPKNRMLADFLVGAHALHHADALLTRDRGYYRKYFPELTVINPQTA